MTNQQKEALRVLRAEGHGYASIAKTVGLSVNTVKSYCRRNSLSGKAPTGTEYNQAKNNPLYCQHCGKSLVQMPKNKPRKFCSDKCRLAWWNNHPSAVNRTAFYSFVCAHCGKEYTVYGRPRSKFCSRACAADHRTSGVSS